MCVLGTSDPVKIDISINAVVYLLPYDVFNFTPEKNGIMINNKMMTTKVMAVILRILS